MRGASSQPRRALRAHRLRAIAGSARAVAGRAEACRRKVISLGVGIAVIDPEELTRLVLKFSMREEGGAVLRRYFRYGGIATADVVGYNLRCGMCWAWRNSSYRLDVGDFMSPEAVADRLVEISRSRGFTQLRISRGELTIEPRHPSPS